MTIPRESEGEIDNFGDKGSPFLADNGATNECFGVILLDLVFHSI